MNLLEFAALMTDLTVAVHEESKSALEEAARVVEAEAKAEIGTLQDEADPFAPWAALQPATIEEKTRLGLPPNMNSDGSPLLRTGDMRDSVQHTVEMHGFDGVAYVGSDDPVAEYQELGTEKIPPRSFLGGALVRKETKVRDLIGGYVYGALVGKKVHQGSIEVIKS